MKKILVTGANGFIGLNICKKLIKLNHYVRGAVRNLDSLLIDKKIKYTSVGNISSETNWDHALEGIDCVIHCAGEAQATNKKDKLNICRIVNSEGTKNLAEQAVKAGVKRLIFLSSVKVYGESTGKPKSLKIFTYSDLTNPQDNYAISKFEAEKALWKIASKTGLEVVVVRLPLVYGHGAKGNLDRLVKLIYSNFPLPLKGIKNKRSLIGIDNLIDVLVRCVEYRNIAGKTFLVSDGEDLSTPKLICLIGSVMGQPVKLFALPKFLLKFFGFILGKQGEINRLTGSLVIDNSYAKEILNWTPSVSVKEGIRRMFNRK